jgi:hypothetical protein
MKTVNVMKVYSLSNQSQKVFESLPQDFKDLFLAVDYADNPDDFVQELAIAFLEDKTPSQARSSARRFTDGGNSIRGSLSLEVEFAQADEVFGSVFSASQASQASVLDVIIAEEYEKANPYKETGFEGLSVAEIVKKTGLTKEAIYYRIKIQSEKASSNLDLFVD